MLAGVQFCLGVISATYDNTANMLTGVCQYSIVFKLPNQPVNDVSTQQIYNTEQTFVTTL